MAEPASPKPDGLSRLLVTTLKGPLPLLLLLGVLLVWVFRRIKRL